MAGRKQRIGRVVFDQDGRMGYCGGYCPEGHKVLLTREDVAQLKLNISKTKKSVTYRLAEQYIKRHPL